MIPPSTGPSAAVAILLALVTLGVWSWQRAVFTSRQPVEVKADPWKKVETEYPITQGLAAVPIVSAETVDAVVRANPFSPARRAVSSPSGAEPSDSGQAVTQPDVAKFVYKGRINLGNRQRAIVEDSAAHKTYFLEVGQAVAGFKVLDIAENRVVLLDPSTNEEVMVSMAAPPNP